MEGMIKVTALLVVVSVLGSTRVAAQECDRLQSDNADELVSYLDGIAPDKGNADCITFAIKRLEKQRYEPAIPVLTRLLSFRRPPTEREKQGLYLHPQIVEEIYPAANALEEIGKSALPAVLEAIKAGSSSSRARENAVSVWMEIYKYESPKGVALLKQEADKTRDATAKLNLRRALSRALAWCNPQDQAECKAAAQAGRSN